MGICCSAFKPFLRNIDKKTEGKIPLCFFTASARGYRHNRWERRRQRLWPLSHMLRPQRQWKRPLLLFLLPLHSFENKFGGFFGVSGFRMINNGKLHVFTSFLIDTKACLYYNDRGSVCEVTQKVLRYSICMEQRKRNNY